MRTLPVRRLAPLVVLVAALVAALVLGGSAPARGAAAAPDSAAAPWAWPIAAPHRVVRGFEAPATPYAAGHRGLDLASAVGAPVLAPADGRVVFAGRIVDRGVLTIDTGGGVVATLEPVTPRVPAGAVVHRGEVVAAVATGGERAAGLLYLGARRDGVYVSPLLLLGAYRRPVLLPIGAWF